MIVIIDGFCKTEERITDEELRMINYYIEKMSKGLKLVSTKPNTDSTTVNTFMKWVKRNDL